LLHAALVRDLAVDPSQYSCGSLLGDTSLERQRC